MATGTQHLQDFLLRREPRTTDPGCAQQRACRQRIPRTVRYHAPSGRRNLFLTRFPPSSDLMKIKAATFFNDATKQRGKMSRRSPLRCCQVPGAEYIRLMAVSSPDLLRLIEKLECPRIAPIALERGETKKGVINGDGAAVWRRRLSQR